MPYYGRELPPEWISQSLSVTNVKYSVKVVNIVVDRQDSEAEALITALGSTSA